MNDNKLKLNNLKNRLCLLAEGRVAYFGDREQAFDFFKR